MDIKELKQKIEDLKEQRLLQKTQMQRSNPDYDYICGLIRGYSEILEIINNHSK